MQKKGEDNFQPIFMRERNLHTTSVAAVQL